MADVRNFGGVPAGLNGSTGTSRNQRPAQNNSSGTAQRQQTQNPTQNQGSRPQDRASFSGESGSWGTAQPQQDRSVGGITGGLGSLRNQTGQNTQNTRQTGSSQQSRPQTQSSGRGADQSRQNGQSGYLDSYSPVVEGLYGQGAGIIDNGAYQGALDRGDTLGYYDNGNYQTRNLNSSELYDINYRQSVVDNSLAMNQKLQNGQITFGDNMNNQKYNTEFWQPENVDGQQYWKVKDGVLPSDAISDVFNPQGGNYSYDCAAATNLVGLKSKLDTIGADDFNNNYNNLMVRGWDTWSQPGGGDWTKQQTIDDISGQRNERGSSDNFIPGDYGYYTNPNVPEGGGPDQGENVMFLGRNESGSPLFFGVPVGIVPSESCSFGNLSSIRGCANPQNLQAMDQSPEQYWT